MKKVPKVEDGQPVKKRRMVMALIERLRVQNQMKFSIWDNGANIVLTNGRNLEMQKPMVQTYLPTWPTPTLNTYTMDKLGCGREGTIQSILFIFDSEGSKHECDFKQDVWKKQKRATAINFA